MITTIRSQLKQSTYRYVVFFLVFVIAMSVISSLFVKSERALSTWALRVNGSEISYHSFAREVAKQSEYIAHIRAQYGQYADMLFQSLGWHLDPKARAIDILVKEELLSQFAAKLGIALHPEYINKIFNNAQFVKQNLGHIVPPFVFDQSGILDMNIVKAFLKQNKISVKEFEGSIEKALIQHHILENIAACSYVPAFDIKQQFIAKHLGKNFSYLSFSFDHYLAEEKKKTVQEDELQAFYDTQNIQFRRYWVPEQRSGMVFRFKPDNYNVAISDEEIQEYYEDNKVKNYVLDPLKVEIEQIFLQPIADSTNKSVEDIEREIRVEKSTEYEKQWKPIKPFSRGEHKGELEKNAFLLQREGEMSPVFESKQGKTIVRLVKRIPRTYKPLVTVKKEIEDILVKKSFKKHFTRDIKNIIANQGSQEIQSFIKEKGAQKEVVTGIFKEDTPLSQQMFSLKKGEYGFFVESGIGVAVMLTEVQERHLPDFASIKDIVRNDFYENAAKKTLEDSVSAAQKEASGKTFSALRDKFGASLQTTGTINPTDHKKLQELGKKGLSAHDLFALDIVGSILLIHGDRTSFLVKLDSVESFDEEKFLAAQKELKIQLEAVRGRLLLDSVVASLHRNATIETNESILITNENYSE